MAALTLPLFPLSTVLFPGGQLLLRVFEPRYLSMVSRCMREEHGFGVVLIEKGSEAGSAEFATTGTLADIVDWHQGSDGLLGLTAEGRERFRVTGYEQQADGLYVGTIQMLAPEPRESLTENFSGLSNLLKGLLEEVGEPYDRMPKDFDDASWVGYRLAEILPLPVSLKQSLLELDDARRRLERLEPHVAELTVSENA
ncbi:MAG: LON peptidase substrate-binding domain-containing protein [Gammaproteobacteria bacterium]|nr:LON peptidase substrate-binding domain-containing protein [Gammaproteobacteria bacterium]MDH3506454.1 LON peptidase substrate-binding domain-containing protein [Gammaproteobacteria bacterium]